MSEKPNYTPESEIDAEEETFTTLPEYISNFEKEIGFDQKVDKRLEEYQTGHPDDPLSSSDKTDLINTMRTDKFYKDSLWNWRENHKISIEQFDLPEEASNAIYKYWQTIENFQRDQRKDFLSKEDIINYDIKRSADHTFAAQKLVESGLAPNITVGRLLIQFMSIEKGYDKEDRGRDEKRLNYFR